VVQPFPVERREEGQIRPLVGRKRDCNDWAEEQRDAVEDVGIAQNEVGENGLGWERMGGEEKKVEKNQECGDGNRNEPCPYLNRIGAI